MGYVEESTFTSFFLHLFMRNKLGIKMFTSKNKKKKKTDTRRWRINAVVVLLRNRIDQLRAHLGSE